MKVNFSYFISIIIIIIAIDLVICSNSEEEESNINLYTLDNICEFTNSINESDTFDLFYVQAPLMYAYYGNLFSKINAYHSGISLLNLNGGSNITCDYFAGPNLVNALIPQNITKDSYGNYNLTWNTYGLIQVTNYINETYWSGRQLIMYGITGSQVKDYLTWLPMYNQSNPVYNLFSIGGVNNNKSEHLIYQNSSTCDDFVWASFNSLYQLGAKTISMQSDPNKDQITLNSKQPPIIADYNNQTTRNQIAKFYLNMEEIANHKNDSATVIFDKLIQLFNGTFYCYINGVYYQLQLSSPNPISFTYSPTALPSGTRNPSSLEYLSNCLINIPNNGSLYLGRFTLIQAIFISISIVFIGVIILYLSIGFTVNKIRGKKGSDLIPNKKLWTSIGSKVTGNNKNNKPKYEHKPLLSSSENTIQ